MLTLRAALFLSAALIGTSAVLAAIPGDFNSDGVISTDDYATWSACLRGPGAATPPGCASTSFDGDSDVDLRDFALWVRAFGTGACQITPSASSTESSPLYDAFNAVDGLRSTRWSSTFADNQWLQLDLDRQRTLTGVTIYWESGYARSYSILISDDESAWSSVFATTSSDGGTDVIDVPAFQARYVRVHCTQRATEWGNSIWEVVLHSPDKCYHDLRDPDVRVDELVAQMTLAEKVGLLYGETAMSLRAVPRLGIPALQLADGPLGIRWGQSTAFPAPITMAATWDTELVHRFGVAMAAEWRNKGRQVWLGPAMNILRVPQCGRNFEYYSEDPFLASRMAVAAVSGVQSGGVVACVKHYACNNQEQDRMTVNVQVDERTLREIYLPAFEAAVREAGALSIMAAYNRVNGAYCTANSVLLDTILKDEWGFRGFVVSDWGAVHETVQPALAGLDLEMDGDSPTGTFWGAGKLLAAVQNASVSVAIIDDKVRRILRAILFTGIMDETWDSPDRPMTEHNALVREIAREGIVLLKNDGNRFPLDKQATQTIAVLGSAYVQAGLGGGGSSIVSPYYSVSPLQGLRNVAGPNTTIVDKPGVLSDTSYTAAATTFLRPPTGSGNGLRGDYYDGVSLSGAIRLTRTDAQVNFSWGGGTPTSTVGNDTFSVRWTGKLVVPTTGTWQVGMATDDGFRMYVGGNLQINDWNNHAVQLKTVNMTLTAGVEYPLVLEYYEDGGDATAIFVCRSNTALGEAVAAAQSADAALVFVGLSPSKESEGFDRGSIDLTGDEVALIRAVAAVNSNTAVIIVAGSQVGLDEWIDEAPVVMQAWYGGQEAGNAIADVVFGDENPSGKLPMTFVRRWQDHPAFGLYPTGTYTDGLNVGYRHFDKPGSAAPAFPFGFGLSYTSFTYSNLQVDAAAFASAGTVRVEFDIQNTGARAGSEVAQVYIGDQLASVPRPEKELKGFAKAALAPGGTQHVVITLDRRAFAFFSLTAHDWVVEAGDFEILVGASSRDIRLQTTIALPAGM